ncbi:MAG: tetratricopeptide repeat protein [Ignavibacteriales bacterium]|nr:tetratricopeptide repeat protein [Ignavibacteriales bacterium]
MIKKIADNPYTYLLCIIILVWIVYYPAVHFDFTNWDDDIHITNNPAVQQISIRSFIQLFLPTPQYMYHPVTMISYMVEWRLSDGSSWLFHLTNIVVHVCNIILVFLVLRQFHLSKTIVIFCTALFGLHPLQVESVAWISARKELLYALFYLLSILFYLYHQQTQAKKYIVISLVAFMLSLLSKPTAITLPFVLIALEYSRSRRSLFEISKYVTPYLLAAILFLFFFLQSPQTKLSPPIEYYSFYQRIVLIVYELSFYIWKFLFPFHLSACYAYPDADVLRAHYYVIPILVAILIAALIYFTVEKKKALFGILLYGIAIVPVLQIIPFHNASLVADRYVYLPIIGLGLFLSHGIQVKKRGEEFDYIAVVLQKLLLGFLILAMSVASLDRLFVWKNSVDLFTDVIEKNPTLALAYGNRANAKLLSGDYNGTIEDCAALLRLNPFDGKAYYNQGNAYSQLGKYDTAIECYNKSILNGFVIANVFYNRGNAYYMSGKIDSALTDYHRSLDYAMMKTESYYSIGYVYLFGKKDYRMAQYYFDSALAGNPASTPSYYYRAECFFNMQQYTNASNDLLLASRIDPNILKTEIFFRVDSAIQSVNRNIDSLTGILSIHPNRISLLRKRSELYFQIGDSVSGNDDVRKIITLRQK